MGSIPVIPPVQPQPRIPTDDSSKWTDIASKQYLDRVLPVHERSLLGGIELRPRNVRFATQNKGEKVYILLRRHWITNLNWMMNTVLLCLVPIVIYAILTFFSMRPASWFDVRVWVIVLLSYYALIFTYIIRQIIDWFFNMYIVTNERIIDYNLNLATTNLGAVEMGLENIEQVKEENVGIIRSTFNYGKLSIFSAADKSVIIFDAIPRPTFVRDIISDLAKVVKNYNRDES